MYVYRTFHTVVAAQGAIKEAHSKTAARAKTKPIIKVDMSKKV